MNKSAIVLKMIDFYNGNIHDIEHFMKVYAYAAAIAEQEKLDGPLADTLEIAAIVHDISCPLCREKYGNTNGKYQELESETLLRPFLEEYNLTADMLERVIYLVSHHHTYTDVDGIDHQILLEADYLVNAAESEYSKESIRHFYESIAKTESGKKMLDSMYLN